MSAGKGEKYLQGIPVSRPVAIGRVAFLQRKETIAPRRLSPEEVFQENIRFDNAVTAAKTQLHTLQKTFSEKYHGDSSLILEAHRMIIQDPLLIEGTKNRIRNDLLPAEWALRHTLSEIRDAFDEISDDYLRERKSDIDFAGEKILQNLAGDSQAFTENFDVDTIVIAKDLSPSDAIALQGSRVIGFATESGAQTSHTAIVARAIEIPAVVGVEGLYQSVALGDEVIVDGVKGFVIVNPSQKTLSHYQEKRDRYLAFGKEIRKNRDLPARTIDGARLTLRANVELVAEVPSAVSYGARGIGLFRTEFLYMNRHNLPTEKEHFDLARQALEQIAPHPIVFRTLDLGGDKLLDPEAFAGEGLCAMRLRAIRLCLKQPRIFRTQLRGLLLASAYGPVRIMFPLISSLEELREAKAVVFDVRQTLLDEGYDLPPAPLGIMIETPSASLLSDALAKEADFFCIGTNDLIQYTLAVDRADEAVAEYYRPLHPAILRMLKTTVEAGHDAHIPVSICGEMAGDPMFTVVLVGLGVDELSMSASAIPAVKHIIRNISYAEAVLFSKTILKLSTTKEIETKVHTFMKMRFPEIFSLRTFIEKEATSAFS